MHLFHPLRVQPRHASQSGVDVDPALLKETNAVRIFHARCLAPQSRMGSVMSVTGRWHLVVGMRTTDLTPPRFLVS